MFYVYEKRSIRGQDFKELNFNVESDSQFKKLLRWVM